MRTSGRHPRCRRPRPSPAGAALAADDMKKAVGADADGMMKKDAMTMQQCKDHMAMAKKDGMKKDDAMMKKDAMCADMMKKDDDDEKGRRHDEEGRADEEVGPRRRAEAVLQPGPALPDRACFRQVLQSKPRTPTAAFERHPP